MQKTFGCCRFVYNHFREQRIELYKSQKKSTTFFGQSRELTVFKQGIPWLLEVDSSALRNSIRNLDYAYKNFFRHIKKGEKPGFPKKKRKRCSAKSYKSSFSNANIKVLDNAIRLPKLGLVKCRVSRQIEGRILSATVSQDHGGKYFVALCCTDVNIEPLPKTGAVVGIKLGLEKFAVTSEGQFFENHKYLIKSEKKLIRLQRWMSRKQKGSAKKEKARVKLARMHEKVANRRKDTLHKLSTYFVKDYDVIAIENLPVKDMLFNSEIAKSISDASWGEFIWQLQYKCDWYEKELVLIDALDPQNQISTCDDVNAANNILSSALSLRA